MKIEISLRHQKSSHDCLTGQFAIESLVGTTKNFLSTNEILDNPNQKNWSDS
jgi:hypothetical protein